MTSTDLHEFLLKLHENGDAVHVREGDLSTIAPKKIIGDALRAGYIRRSDGSGWGTDEGFEITPLGLAMIGVMKRPGKSLISTMIARFLRAVFPKSSQS